MEKLYTVIEMAEIIPVWPKSMFVGKSKVVLASNAPLCEDDDGRVSFVSKEAKAKYVKMLKRKKKRTA